jgi:hypothetical protein
MNSIAWGVGWQAVQLSPWWLDYHAATSPDQQYQWQPVPISGAEHARDLLYAAGADAPVLRDALDAASTDLTRLPDSAIVEHVASLVADGQLVLLRKVLTPEAAKIPTQYGPVMVRESDSAGPESSVKNVIKAAYAVAPRAVSTAPPVEVSDFISVDQDLQAAALRAAAVNGTPFCEVCEKARLARAQA